MHLKLHMFDRSERNFVFRKVKNKYENKNDCIKA